ncbi:hypothetical protein GmHk_10G028060 [Glycine max]|nr:hypothetical protein GmHk_10G028060 [Glycine max]
MACHLPSFVEYKWIRELLFYLHLRLKNFSRNKIVFNLWRIHVDEKENVKLAMHIAHCRICLTADVRLLLFEPSTWWSWNDIIIFEVLLDWGMDRKIFSITLDNCARIESYCSRGPKGDSQCLKNIRNSIKYVKALEARKIAFKECVLQVSGIGTKPLNGIPPMLCLKVQLSTNVLLVVWLFVIETMFNVHQMINGKAEKM